MNDKKTITKFDIQRLEKVFSDSANNATIEDQKNIYYLQQALNNSKIVDPKKINKNIITMNSKFCLQNIGNGARQVYSLVFPYESDINNNKLSVLSEIGAEVLGAKAGAVIKINSNMDQYFVIEEILYQPEASGDYHL